MIEVMLFVGVLLVIVAIWFFCGRVDNTYCLEFKESVDKRFQRYARMEPYGDKLSRVSALVAKVPSNFFPLKGEFLDTDKSKGNCDT